MSALPTFQLINPPSPTPIHHHPIPCTPKTHLTLSCTSPSHSPPPSAFTLLILTSLHSTLLTYIPQLYSKPCSHLTPSSPPSHTPYPIILIPTPYPKSSLHCLYLLPPYPFLQATISYPSSTLIPSILTSSGKDPFICKCLGNLSPLHKVWKRAETFSGPSKRCVEDRDLTRHLKCSLPFPDPSWRYAVCARSFLMFIWQRSSLPFRSTGKGQKPSHDLHKGHLPFSGPWQRSALRPSFGVYDYTFSCLLTT